jgi:hypothetical protein
MIWSALLILLFIVAAVRVHHCSVHVLTMGAAGWFPRRRTPAVPAQSVWGADDQHQHQHEQQHHHDPVRERTRALFRDDHPQHGKHAA